MKVYCHGVLKYAYPSSYRVGWYRCTECGKWLRLVT